jgi:FKBP-type peptidyl-prolyl cis-trans isomerase SlyD
MSIIIGKDTVASVHYHGTLTESGETFDRSEGSDLLTFLVGHQQMIPGFEAALIGKRAGDELRFNLTPEDAYGNHEPEGVQQVPVDQLPEEVSVGDQLMAETPDGHMVPLRVTEIDEDVATIDMNHELAGHALTFDVKVESVREATAEELDHGHVHGPGGHHH